MSAHVDDFVAHIRDDLNRSKMGVLIIHGIGEQQPGASLLNATEPLLRWFRSEFGQDNVEILSTNLKGSSHEPANTTIRVQVNTEYNSNRKYSKDEKAPTPRYKTCVFAEAHWADAFIKPDFRELVSWTFLAIPNVIATQFVRGATRLSTEANRISRFPGLILAAIAHLLSLLLAIFVQILVVLMLPLALIPGLGSWVMKVQQMLSSIVGDSLIFVGSPIQQSAIVSKAHQSLEWIGERSNVLAVVAHSQGAAVGYKLILSEISSPQREKIKLFFTLGSGLGKLNDLQINSIPGMHRLWGLLFVATTVGIVAMLPDFVNQISLPIDKKTGDAVAVLGPIFGGIAWMILYFVLYSKSGENRVDLLTKFPMDTIHWVDRYAKLDMVPAGPLIENAPEEHYLPDRKERRESINRYITQSGVVSNLDSLFRDHTSYWQNEDEFVPTVGHQLAKVMGERSGLFDLDNKVACRRRWRLTWRNGLTQYAVGLLLLSVWMFRDLLPIWGENILAKVGIYLQRVPAWLYEAPQLPLTTTSKLFTGLLVPIGAFLALTWVFNFMWGQWNSYDTHKGHTGDLDGGGFLFAMMLWVAIALPGVLFLLLPDTPSLVLPFEENTIARNFMTYLWMIVTLIGLLTAVAISRIRKNEDFKTWEQGFTYLPLAVILSFPFAFYMANNFSDTYLTSGTASTGRQILSGSLVLVFIGLVAFMVLLLQRFGSMLDEWLLNVSVNYGKVKPGQSETTIGWFGVVLSLFAFAVSMFVPQFLSWQALLFNVLCLAAALAAINASRRDVILLDVLTGSILFYAIFLHGHLRNWWIG
ncbi:hypothetical protein [Candidatus Nitrotoga sp. M5]|uniref:hypothetical protein n=1 Tax=Candidatus Nitrotoga sp. M5 TaxID=2890409 RepID=UPI001EF21F72|nr:hypothetical protein [Candidatus Nitrotoga sp. M5]CAH1386582.1 membrane hypothetical protein [Candidatus Nitrotoga sp. M5]